MRLLGSGAGGTKPRRRPGVLLFALCCDLENATFAQTRVHPGKMASVKFMELFGRLKSVVIGMIHVNALPGNRDILTRGSAG